MSDETAHHEHSNHASDGAEGDSPLAVVGALMEERRKFESWLSTLEARRAATPDRVFTRVHADYSSRLEGVVEELKTHTAGLRAELAVLTDRLGGIEEDQQRQRDDRAEAELRAHVGELSPTAWDELAANADRAIEELTVRHGEVERELIRTRELLTEAERPTPPRDAKAIPVPERVEPAVTASLEAPMSANGAPREADVTLAAERASTAGEEIPTELPPSVIAAEAALVDEAPSVERREADVTPAPTQRADGGRHRTGAFDELAFLSSVVDTPTGTVDIPAPTDRADERTRRDSFAHRGDEIVNLSDDGSSALDGSAPSLAAPLAMNVTGNIPIVIRDKATETTKTLKCSDCGAMNYPTEWYCERCGAELASL
jgi:hypothetical protein